MVGLPQKSSRGDGESNTVGLGVCACACLSAALISVGSHPLGTWGQEGVHAMLKVKSHASAHGHTQAAPKCLAHSALSTREFQKIFLQLKILNLYLQYGNIQNFEVLLGCLLRSNQIMLGWVERPVGSNSQIQHCGSFCVLQSLLQHLVMCYSTSW